MTVGRRQIKEARGQSSHHVDQLTESALQSSILGDGKADAQVVDIQRLRTVLEQESHIPKKVVDEVLHHIQDHLPSLGLAQPHPPLILHWLTGLLREKGFGLGGIPLHSLELSLSQVELNIYHPVGVSAGADQNPEATSKRIAQRIKGQFARLRVYQDDVVQAHEDGRIELLHLGSIDRPHNVFLTPDYLKLAGLPVTSGAPAAGPAKSAEVLLAHLIRFTHELQNHFAGDIHWGYVNTLLLPFLEGMSPRSLRQFAQQLLFEFAQLDVERGGLDRQVILDFDLDFPKILRDLPARGPGGQPTGKPYHAYRDTFQQFNQVLLEVLAEGDHRGNPFHSPHIIYHINDPESAWTEHHRFLLEIACKHGNPSLAFSHRSRFFGPLGQVPVTDADLISLLREPANLRAFSSSSLAINLPRLCYGLDQPDFAKSLGTILDIAASAYRQKRLFLSRLMAYGNRGPLQFLRHKFGGQSFLKIDSASQALQVVGLGDAARIQNGSPAFHADAITAASKRLLTQITEAIGLRNRHHKLNMKLSSTKNESLAYRFAALDLRLHGHAFAPYVLHQADQAHPIYTEGSNILAFEPLRWQDRLRLEGQLHGYFDGFQGSLLFLTRRGFEDTSLYQRVFREAHGSGIRHLRLVPDLAICLSCYHVFGKDFSSCPGCASTMVTPYSYCQSQFSAVNSWCLGKRSEWQLRHRMDSHRPDVQPSLPW